MFASEQELIDAIAGLTELGLLEIEEDGDDFRIGLTAAGQGYMDGDALGWGDAE